jgi:uncharacterized membrane protein
LINMPEAPTQVILAAFKDEHGAEAALEQLRAAQKEHLIAIDNVAILRCDQKGQLHIKEPTDMGGRRGAAIGGAVGAVAGLLFGPLVLATAGGAAIGGLAAKLRDSGFDDKRLRQLGQNLQPGTSAILTVIQHTWVSELEAELEKAGADVVTEQIGSDIAAELKAGRDVAYTALVTDDTVIAMRAAEDRPEPEAATPKTPSAQMPASTGQTPAQAPEKSTPPSAPSGDRG